MSWQKAISTLVTCIAGMMVFAVGDLINDFGLRISRWELTMDRLGTAAGTLAVFIVAKWLYLWKTRKAQAS